MEESKAASTTKIAFKNESWEIEKYVTEISIPQNFLALQPGESPLSIMQFPKGSEEFKSGTLSKTQFVNTILGSFSRETCELVINQFLLPEMIESKKLTMKPFRVELLAKNKIVADFIKEFLEQNSKYSDKANTHYTNYSTQLDFSSIWKDEIDLIRITWNIRAQENVARFVTVLNDIDKEMMDSDHLIAVKKEMASLYNSNVMSDASLRCGTEVIPVHRFVLGLVSPVFRNMFEIEMKEKKNGEVIIEDIDIKILGHMIRWIYTGCVGDFVYMLQDRVDLFKAAHKYQIETLKNLCTNRICASISSENVLGIYSALETYEEPKILKRALEIMKANKDKVFGNEKISEEFVLRYPKVMLNLFKD